MRIEAVLLALLMVTAGCIGSKEGPGGNESSNQTGDSGQQPSPTGPQRVELTYELEVGPQVSEGAAVGTFGEDVLGSGPATLLVELSWSQSSNRFGLETERADGTIHRIQPQDAPGSTSLEGEVPVDAIDSGTYEFRALASQGPVVQDTVELTVDVPASMLGGGQAGPAGGAGEVRTEQTSDGWKATIVYRANGTAQDSMSIEANTVNGAIGLAGTGESSARAAVEAFAKADTEERAIERVREIQVTVSVEGEGITATAELPDGEKWDNRGAHVEVQVPGDTTTSGLADTTNGPIQLESLAGRDLSLDTTNGPVQGDLAGEGEIQADTTNGPIDLAFTPTGSSQLSMDSTNGPIQLELAEGSDIAYRIDADTTNGQISEEMDEARLDRQGEGEATLVTEEGDGRSIQVTGETDTTNGDIAFTGG